MKLHITLLTLDKPLVTLDTNKQVPFKSLPAWYFFYRFCRLLTFFQNQLFFEKCFQEYHQGFKQFGRACSGSRLFAKFTSKYVTCDQREFHNWIIARWLTALFHNIMMWQYQTFLRRRHNVISHTQSKDDQLIWSSDYW